MGYPNPIRISTRTVSRAKTARLWRNQQDAFVSGLSHPDFGTGFFEDFLENAYSNLAADAGVTQHSWWVEDSVAAGAPAAFMSSQSSPDGVVRFGATTTNGAANEGIEAQRGASAATSATVVLPTHTTDPRGRVVFEAYVNLTSAPSYFIGLSEPVANFFGAASVLNATNDYIGFYRIATSGSGSLLFVTSNNGTGGTADSATLLTNANLPTGYVKLGFAVNADNTVEIFVNEVFYATASASINPLALPNETLTPHITVVSSITTPEAAVAADFDWIGCHVDT